MHSIVKALSCQIFEKPNAFDSSDFSDTFYRPAKKSIYNTAPKNDVILLTRTCETLNETIPSWKILSCIIKNSIYQLFEPLPWNDPFNIHRLALFSSQLSQEIDLRRKWKHISIILTDSYFVENKLLSYLFGFLQ